MEVVRIALAFRNGTWFAVLVDSQNWLVASAFSQNRQALKEHMTHYGRKVSRLEAKEEKHELAEEMARLFQGEKARHPARLRYERPSPFQKRVYDVLGRIPRGRVTSYGLIAKTIGSGPRAVGGAVASNPWPLFIPCHRVVPGDLVVGKYSMSGRPSHEASQVKRRLLEREGVSFLGDNIQSSSLWDPALEA